MVGVPYRSLNEWRDHIHQWARGKGWWDTADDQNVPTKLALIHSEVSEALEDYRNGKMESTFSYTGDGLTGVSVRQALGSDTLEFKPRDFNDIWRPLDHEAYLSLGFTAKPEGFPSELADTIIRICDLAGFLGIDLDAEMEKKMEYNQTRPQRHGGKRV